MSDSPEMQEWLKRQGVGNSAEARGEPSAPVDVSAEFIEPESEMDTVLQASSDGHRIRLWDSYGFNNYFDPKEFRAWIAKHGKLDTWDKFTLLGQSNLKVDIEGDE